MSSEMKQSEDQVEENEEDLRATPEIPQVPPVVQEGNGEILSESNCNEIKNEPTDNETSEERLQTEMPVNTSEPNVDNESLNTNVVVKNEPVNEIDYDMPIGKTPVRKSEQTCEINAKLHSSAHKDKPSNEHLDESSAKIASDEYLDGLATPLMPRLRVKPEFDLQRTAQNQDSPENDFSNKNIDAMDTGDLPPPPPIFSSNSNSNFVADGIATPRISLAPTNRLRVKTEFAFPPPTPKRNEEDTLALPDDYFDDLMDIKIPSKETGEVSPSISDDASEDEPIPQDFFDDLLRDKLKERIQVAQNNELEEKYSDRLKEYERLKNELKEREKRRKSKKQKKSKKKSRKRSRSRSLSPSSKRKEKHFNDLPNYDRNKRSRVSPPRGEMPSGSNYAPREVIDDNFLRVDPGFKIKSEFQANDLANNDKESEPFIENVEEVEEVLTPKQKREKAIKRATDLLKYLKETSDDNSILSTFLFVSTVRKLPTSHSYVQQQMYENRSPLHTVNNVSYKFNSHTIRFTMEEWGLAALPPNAAKMAKLVGCDAQFIHNKLKTIKIPAKLKKVKQEPNTTEADNEEEEELIETSSSLYSNAMTQTDDISEFAIPRKEKGYEIGVQVEPDVFSIGCQTLETQSPTENVHKDDEAPIMKIIHDLNENQLMAIHAFAELIKEPNTSANAMEMYKIQMKILDIYKMSQIPSALASAQPPIVNNYTTTTTKSRDQPPIRIKSVTGADGKQFSVNDPRSRSAAYSKRTANDDIDSSSNYDSRYSSPQASHGRSSAYEGFSPSPYNRSSGNESRRYSDNSPTRQRQIPVYSSHTPPHTAKHYGRGGLRR